MNFSELAPSIFIAVALSLGIGAKLYQWNCRYCFSGSSVNSILEKSEVEKHDDDGHSDDDDSHSDETGNVVVNCFFGSQTGTAEAFAKDLAKRLTHVGFKTKVIDLETTNEDFFKQYANCDSKTGHNYHIYFMATYGEGDPTDNAINFMAYLSQSEYEGGPTQGIAKNVRFSVFALGNTQYENYNNIGKSVRDRLLQLGGKELHHLGLGDDDQDIEDDFNEWQEGLVGAFSMDAFGRNSMSSDQVESQIAISEPTYQFRAVLIPKPRKPSLILREGRTECDSKTAQYAGLSSRHLFQGVSCPIVENRELCQRPYSSGGNGSTVHIEVDISRTDLTYSTTDSLTICSQNDERQVCDAARYLGLEIDQWFVLRSSEKNQVLFPTPCTVRTALAFFTDLNGSPSRSLLSQLAAFVTIPQHAARLRFLASKEGTEDYHHYVTDRQLSVIEVLESFPSFSIRENLIGPFFEVMPRLKAREYTISSSSLTQPSRIGITVGIIRDEKIGEPPGRDLNGVCSTYLQRCMINDYVFCFVRKSTFRMPNDPTVPILMIGPGTGVAPMRAFIQERAYQREAFGEFFVGESVLFFGCRNENEDFLYKDELLSAVECGSLTTLYTAFSRQQAEKVYVQHIMENHKAEVWRLLIEGAHIYVCGATRMGKDVHETLAKICTSEGDFPDFDAGKEFLVNLQKNGRYIQELWSH